MKKYKLLIKYLGLLLFISYINNVNAQTGLNFQGVARNSNNIILASQPITIRLSILRDHLDATKTEEYIETRRVMTNAQGLFTAVIGDTGAISSLGIFTNINWKLTPKFLKIEGFNKIHPPSQTFTYLTCDISVLQEWFNKAYIDT